MSKERVVCTTDAFLNYAIILGIKGVQFPKKGEIYTIREVVKNRSYLFHEIVNLPHKDFDEPEPSFGITCFRPVDDSFGEWVESTVLKQAELEEATN